MIESRNAVGQYDTTLQLKAQVPTVQSDQHLEWWYKESSNGVSVLFIRQIEQLTGRNEELRHELHGAREETAKALVQLEKRKSKVRNTMEH